MFLEQERFIYQTKNEKYSSNNGFTVSSSQINSTKMIESKEELNKS